MTEMGGDLHSVSSDAFPNVLPATPKLRGDASLQTAILNMVAKRGNKNRPAKQNSVAINFNSCVSQGHGKGLRLFNHTGPIVHCHISDESHTLEHFALPGR